MMVIPKVDIASAPTVTEYHHMDQLEFSYYHADKACQFKDILCLSSQCSFNRGAAFVEHLRLKMTTFELVSNINSVIIAI